MEADTGRHPDIIGTQRLIVLNTFINFDDRFSHSILRRELETRRGITSDG